MIETYKTIVGLNDRVLELEEDIDLTDKLLTFAVYNMTDKQYDEFLKYEQELMSEPVHADKCTSAHKIK